MHSTFYLCHPLLSLCQRLNTSAPSIAIVDPKSADFGMRRSIQDHSPPMQSAQMSMALGADTLLRKCVARSDKFCSMSCTRRKFTKSAKSSLMPSTYQTLLIKSGDTFCCKLLTKPNLSCYKAAPQTEEEICVHRRRTVARVQRAMCHGVSATPPA